jgi:hypothetical protein
MVLAADDFSAKVHHGGRAPAVMDGDGQYPLAKMTVDESKESRQQLPLLVRRSSMTPLGRIPFLACCPTKRPPVLLTKFGFLFTSVA